MQDYYQKRAHEYEAIYYRDDPIRQQEQQHLIKALQTFLKNRHILEIACGTGYWTQFLSQTAQQITATDAVDDVLELAKQKKYLCPVTFEKADAYHLPYPQASFDAGLANFWFSHIPKEHIDEFLRGLHTALKSGAKIFMADNVYAEGMGGKLIKKSGDANTYKIRTLENGAKHEIVKNYYAPQELLTIFQKYIKVSEKNMWHGRCFWSISYQLS